MTTTKRGSLRASLAAPDPANPSVTLDTACPAGSGHDAIELPPMAAFLFNVPLDDADNVTGPTVTPLITRARSLPILITA